MSDPSDDEIVPLYLYTKREKVTLIAKDRLHSFKGTEEQIQVINPLFRPIPPGANLFSAIYTNGGTTSLLQTYDPFNVPKNSVQFIAWVEPIPYTTPLYVYQNNEYIYCSFDQEIDTTDLKQISFSPIYVFTDKESAVRIDNKQFNGDNESHGARVSDDAANASVSTANASTGAAKASTGAAKAFHGADKYKFSPYKGRCIPDPLGTSMAQCIDQHVKGKGRYTLLSYLDSKYNSKTANVLFYVTVAILLCFVAVFVIKHVV